MQSSNIRLLLIIPLAFFACSAGNIQKDQTKESVIQQDTAIEQIEEVKQVFSPDRSSILTRISKKKSEKQPLVIDLYVPLCDNDNQGIVPVNSSLGNGFNLRTNLYWGAGYGIGYYFTASNDWKLMAKISQYDKETAEIRILRAVFGGDTVFMVARAYWGDQMKECVDDFFRAVSGWQTDTFTLNDSKSLILGEQTDLVGFNGHNGLMDLYPYESPVKEPGDTIHRDVVIIGCVSYDYFTPHLKFTAGYPLVTTKHLMAPEAYVLEPVLKNWALGKSAEEIRLSAGDGYNRIQQCGLRGARNLFRTGW